MHGLASRHVRPPYGMVAQSSGGPGGPREPSQPGQRAYGGEEAPGGAAAPLPLDPEVQERLPRGQVGALRLQVHIPQRWEQPRVGEAGEI